MSEAVQILITLGAIFGYILIGIFLAGLSDRFGNSTWRRDGLSIPFAVLWPVGIVIVSCAVLLNIAWRLGRGKED